ncbi:MAG: LysM peptidoglycan-binding domain-containing protein, partial [Oscillospiraceae bacterium]|nr:LysM peptidoglycan-binding domain-containing protein [Oscillospiraceae bacterium]
LTAVQVESSAEKLQDLPNLILRALSSEETLWDLAKQYRTTVNEILTANELSDQSAAAVGELLLIPRRR